MREHNNGTKESDILQSRFTAYLLVALRRQKKQYQLSEIKRTHHELHTDLLNDSIEYSTDPDMMSSLPVLEQIENESLLLLLKNIKKRDLYIFLEKALGNHSINEIAARLEIGFNTTKSAYYRLITHIKNELGGDGK
jgi:DNA-directed RNA polymerase specialized sigma24 family protein